MDSRDNGLTESEREFVADFNRELTEVVEAAGARLPTPKEEAKARAKARDVQGADLHAKLIAARRSPGPVSLTARHRGPAVPAV
jgi:hypothetical protein